MNDLLQRYEERYQRGDYVGLTALLTEHRPGPDASNAQQVQWLALSAELCITTKYMEQAASFLRRAVDLAQSVAEKGRVLCDLVWLARLGSDLPAAKQYAEQYLALPGLNQDPGAHRYKGRVLSDLAHAEADAHNAGRAIEHTQAALAYLHSPDCADPDRVHMAGYCRAWMGWVMHEQCGSHLGQQHIVQAWPDVPRGWRTVVASWGVLTAGLEDGRPWMRAAGGALADARDPHVALAWFSLAKAHRAMLWGRKDQAWRYLAQAEVHATAGLGTAELHAIQRYRSRCTPGRKAR